MNLAMKRTIVKDFLVIIKGKMSFPPKLLKSEQLRPIYDAELAKRSSGEAKGGKEMINKNVSKMVLGVFVAFIFGLVGCGGGGDSSPATQSTQATSIAGAWKTGTLTLTIASNGSYTTVDNVNGVNLTGTYSTSGNQLTITDTGGTGSCTAGQATGTYTYAIGGGGSTLTLTKVSDNCTGRTNAINGLNFTRPLSDDSNNVPTLISPLSGYVNSYNPHFKWQPVPGATYYRLYYDGMNKWDEVTYAGAAIMINGNCEVFDLSIAEGGVTWKVKAYVNGAWQPYSRVAYFEIHIL